MNLSTHGRKAIDDEGNVESQDSDDSVAVDDMPDDELARMIIF
jgi:hypothetical protein